MSPDGATPRPSEAFKRMSAGRNKSAFAKFTNMSDAQIQDLLDCAVVQRIDLESKVFEEGETADRFFLLLDGIVMAARTTSDGEQVIVRHFMPGQLFGIARAFENDTYRTTARVVVEGLALSWPSETWDRFIRESPEFLSASRRAIGERFDDMQEKFVSMATLKVEQRIAQAILRLVEKAGIQTKDGTEISFPITRQDISEMTGTTLHSVSRYMSKWQKSGIVSSQRRRVTVRRPEDLPVYGSFGASHTKES